jgi:hypothetical protein
MPEDYVQMIMDAALEQDQPIAYATRAFHLARKVSDVGRARWVTDGAVLADPSELEPLIAAFTSLQIAATDEYVIHAESWVGVKGAPTRLQTLRHLFECFKHAVYQLESLLITAKPSAVLLEVNAELLMLIARLEAACKEA